MPPIPYYAVVFSSIRTDEANDLYHETADQMFELARQQPGFLGAESVREGKQGITIAYWDSLENVKNWKSQSDHVVAQKMGREMFYEAYHVRITKVEREYHWEKRSELKKTKNERPGAWPALVKPNMIGTSDA
jgi:heme-degrading monooxygenase HmoA